MPNTRREDRGTRQIATRTATKPYEVMWCVTTTAHMAATATIAHSRLTRG